MFNRRNRKIHSLVNSLEHFTDVKNHVVSTQNDLETAKNAVNTLVDFPSEEIIPIVHEVFGSKKNLPYNICETLYNLNNERSLTLLVAFLDTRLESSATFWLGKMAKESQVFVQIVAPLLIKRFKSDNPYAIEGIYEFIFDFPYYISEVADELFALVEYEFRQISDNWDDAHENLPIAINMLSLTGTDKARDLAKKLLFDSRTTDIYDGDFYGFEVQIAWCAGEVLCRLLRNEDKVFIRQILTRDVKNELIADRLFYILDKFGICGFEEEATQWITERLHMKGTSGFYIYSATHYLGMCGEQKHIGLIKRVANERKHFAKDTQNIITRIEQRLGGLKLGLKVNRQNRLFTYDY